MSTYGVSRLAVFDTAGFSEAVLDLSRPVHLAAPNNEGKSSLISALQFLYIDSIDKMHFAHHATDKTRGHYFASDRSYLVFECLTPSGIRCMLVHGLGEIQGCEFERWVFDGEFNINDFVGDDGIVASFETVRKRLAGRNLFSVKATHLWEVLLGIIPAKIPNSPTLRVLPLRTREEYHAFRDAYVKLLSLANVTADALQRLIINCNAREIGEQRINVAVEYREQFERAERRERELKLVEAVAIKVREGLEIRRSMADAVRRLSCEGAALANNIRRGADMARRALSCADMEICRLDAKLTEITDSKSEKQRQLIDAESDRKVAERDSAALGKLHERFVCYSPELVNAKRENLRSFEERVAQLRSTIRDAGKYDAGAMRRDLVESEGKVYSDLALLEAWDKSVASTALREGLTHVELANAFSLLNPGILRLPVGGSVDVRDMRAVVRDVQAIARDLQNGYFDSPSVRIDLTSARPDLHELEDRDAFRNQVALRQSAVVEKKRRLLVAEDQEKASNELIAEERELAERSQEIRDYDRYVETFEQRSELEAAIAAALTNVAQSASEMTELERAAEAVRGEANRHRQQCGDLDKLTIKLESDWAEWLTDTAALGVTVAAVDVAKSANASDADVRHSHAMITSSQETLSALRKLVSDVHQLRERVTGIEAQIKQASRLFPGQQIYFSEPDEDWEELAEKVEAVEQLRATARQEWESLYVTLGARFEGMASGLVSVEKAVRRLNAGLRSYRVSNLKAVVIEPKRNHETAFIVEALAGQNSVFRDRQREDEARQRLKEMIECGRVVELRSMFHLSIATQANDETWQYAASLDQTGSTGTAITAKAMIFIQLVRAVASDERYRLPFYLDESGSLDDENLHAATEMAVLKGLVPITAEPAVRVEPLAHPEVTVHMLGTDAAGKVRITKHNTLSARRSDSAVAGARNG